MNKFRKRSSEKYSIECKVIIEYKDIFYGIKYPTLVGNVELVIIISHITFLNLSTGTSARENKERRNVELPIDRCF